MRFKKKTKTKGKFFYKFWIDRDRDGNKLIESCRINIIGNTHAVAS